MLEEVIVALVAVNCLITLWIMRIIVLEVQRGVANIDHQLASAIQKVVEGGIGDIEPINPIQQALAEMLTQRMKGQQTIIEIPRDEGGKFTKD